VVSVPQLAFPFPLTADSTAIEKALNYFKANQRDDGGFGDGGITEWVMIAISSAGQDPRQWHKNGKTPLDYLKAKSPTDNPYEWIRTTLALCAVGEDPRNFNSNDYVQKIKGYYQANQFGDPLSLRDDYWAVLALIAAGEKNSPAVRDSVRFIVGHQNRDGSWSASTTGIETCVDNTAIAMIALSAAGLDPKSEAILKGLNYLNKHQLKDGGFSYLFMPSNTASASMVMQSLSVIGKDPSEWKKGNKNLLNHLLGLQSCDGSFLWTADSRSNPLLMTAYAVPALLGRWFPIHPSQSNLCTIGLRIEGEGSTILNTQLTLGPVRSTVSSGFLHKESTPTPFSAVIQATAEYGLSPEIERDSLGLYLRSLQGEMGGWQYRVNDCLPMKAANEQQLNPGDEVLWFYDSRGCKSPLRIVPERVVAWQGESVRVIVEQYGDVDAQWKRAKDAWVTCDGARYPAPDGFALIPFTRKGTYSLQAEKECAIRSISRTVSVEEVRDITVHLRIEDNGMPLFNRHISFHGLQTEDIYGHKIEIRRPVALGTLDAACGKGLLTYRTIQTAEGLILASIAGLAEDNQNGSWWYRINDRNVFEDVDECLLKDGDSLLFYRSKYPK